MTTIEVIEKIYEKWDGTEPQAAELLRYIHLVITNEKSRNNSDEMIQKLITSNP